MEWLVSSEVGVVFGADFALPVPSFPTFDGVTVFGDVTTSVVPVAIFALVPPPSGLAVPLSSNVPGS